MNDLLRPRIWPSFLASSGFVVSRQQCIKYPGLLIGSQKSPWLHGNLVEIESGQVLPPEKQRAA